MGSEKTKAGAPTGLAAISNPEGFPTCPGNYLEGKRAPLLRSVNP